MEVFSWWLSLIASSLSARGGFPGSPRLRCPQSRISHPCPGFAATRIRIAVGPWARWCSGHHLHPPLEIPAGPDTFPTIRQTPFVRDRPRGRKPSPRDKHGLQDLKLPWAPPPKTACLFLPCPLPFPLFPFLFAFPLPFPRAAKAHAAFRVFRAPLSRGIPWAQKQRPGKRPTCIYMTAAI